MGRADLYNSEYFLINSLAISKDYTNFAGMMSTAIYNKGGKIQGNVAFLASFNVLYLAVSLEKLHTHTHTMQTYANHAFSYARVEQDNLLPASRQAAGSNALCPFANSKLTNIFTKRALLSSLYLTHFRSRWSGTENGAFNPFQL